MAVKNNTVKNAIDALRQAYSRWAEGSATEDDMKTVMSDLRRFCRSGSSTFHPDPRTHALLEGRREVFLRIEQFSTMSTEELIETRKLEVSPQ